MQINFVPCLFTISDADFLIEFEPCIQHETKVVKKIIAAQLFIKINFRTTTQRLPRPRCILFYEY